MDVVNVEIANLDDLKKRFVEICATINRPGMEDLMAWLERSDFYTAPASTRFHGNYTGGLLEHSINVYDKLSGFVARYPELEISPETVAVTALFHDLTKVNYYTVSSRNVKDDVTGAWHKEPFYKTEDRLPLGHGEKSVIVLQSFIKLTRDEIVAIRWHMGSFDCAVKGVDPSLNIGDITKADEKSVPDFNTMFGGSPCQDFSIAGKQGGAAWSCKSCGHTYNPLEAHYTMRDKCPKCGSTEIEKTRSSLLVEWLRFLREKKPRFAIYENVKNIVGARFKATFDLFVKELEDYGYNVYWQVLNAKNYGIPQNRERVYCVIIRRDLDNGKFQFPSPIPLKHTLIDMLEKEVDERYYLSDDKVAGMIAPPAA